jgi:hypothetical protein
MCLHPRQILAPVEAPGFGPVNQARSEMGALAPGTPPLRLRLMA